MEESLEARFETVVLEKLRFFLRQYISKALLDDIKVEVCFDPILDGCMLSIKGWVWSREIFKEAVERISYPSTWWEAFKERWFPKFLKKRFPVKYTYHNITIHHIHTCPHLNYKIDAPHVAFMSMKGVKIENRNRSIIYCF